MNWSDYAKDIETYQREVRDLRCEADVLNALYDAAKEASGLMDEYDLSNFIRRYGSKP